MASNGNNTILWLLGGAVAGWYLFLRDEDEEPEQFPDLHHPVKHSWADTLTGRAMRMGRTDLVTEIDDAMSSWQQGVSDEDDELLDERLEAVERVLEAELMADPDYRSNPSPSAPKIRHRDLGTGVVLDFDYADDGSLLCFVAWTAQRGTGGGWYDLTSGPFRTDDAAAFKAFYEDWRLQRNPSYRAGSTVAETILQQLGGAGRLRAMIGAKYFIDHGGALSFKFPNRQRSRGNYVKITLTPEDYYDMEFGQLMKHAVKPVKAYRGIMWDQLIEVFEQQTGLYLRL